MERPAVLRLVSGPSRRWTLIGVLLLFTAVVHISSAIEVGGNVGKQTGAKVAVAKHTTSDHVREVLGRVFGRDDHSGSHSSSSSDERSSDRSGGRWGRNRDNCRYVSRSGKFCKCDCYDRNDRSRSGLFGWEWVTSSGWCFSVLSECRLRVDCVVHFGGDQWEFVGVYKYER